MSSLNIHFSAYRIIVMIWIYYRYTFEFLLQHLYINENDCTCSHHVCILNMMERILQVKVLFISFVVRYLLFVFNLWPLLLFFFSSIRSLSYWYSFSKFGFIQFYFSFLLDILFVGGSFKWRHKNICQEYTPIQVVAYCEIKTIYWVEQHTTYLF